MATELQTKVTNAVMTTYTVTDRKRGSRKVERMSDEELRVYMREMSRTVGKYAARQYDFALAEAIRREESAA